MFNRHCHEELNDQDHLLKEDIEALNSYRHNLNPAIQPVKEPFPGEILPDPDLGKDNEHATRIRSEGNRLYHNKSFTLALDKYYESICWATMDSIDIVKGYSNCSAVYYETAEYECALICIHLAQSYRCSSQLIDKLLKREAKCAEKLQEGQGSRVSQINSGYMVNVEMNPYIPFLAEGIRMKELPGHGRSMVADREFNPGELIVDEKVMLRTLESGNKYSVCHHCFATLVVLKNPCPDCVSVIYCSNECQIIDMDMSHRFECGISGKLDRVHTGASRIGLRLFFYGLRLFYDDMDKMMRFCQTHGRTDSNPFTLDYSNYDPLEEFQVLHQTKVPYLGPFLTASIMAHAANYYWILANHRTIHNIFCRGYSQDEKDFQLHFMFVYIRAAHFLANYRVTGETTQLQLYSLASICNHSYIPNTSAISVEGHLKFVVLRPILMGEQILVSYNIVNPPPGLDLAFRGPQKPCGWLGPDALNLKCKCLDCDPEKKRTRLSDCDYCIQLPEGLEAVWCRYVQSSELGEQLNGMRMFMQNYGHLHPYPCFYNKYIKSYNDTLIRAMLIHENERRNGIHANQRRLPPCDLRYKRVIGAMF